MSREQNSFCRREDKQQQTSNVLKKEKKKVSSGFRRATHTLPCLAIEFTSRNVA